MKLILEIDETKLTEEQLIKLGEITDREIFPLKSAPEIEIVYNPGVRDFPNFLKTRCLFRIIK